MALFVREPFGYFLSRGQKKNHSISRLGRNDLSAGGENISNCEKGTATFIKKCFYETQVKNNRKPIQMALKTKILMPNRKNNLILMYNQNKGEILLEIYSKNEEKVQLSSNKKTLLQPSILYVSTFNNLSV